MSDAVSSLRAADAGGGAGGGNPGGFTALADRDTFLRLLVVQVRNQDPLNPQEPVEFVGQLAQFSQLETLLAMRSSLETIEAGLAGTEAVPQQTLSSRDSESAAARSEAVQAG